MSLRKKNTLTALVIAALYVGPAWGQTLSQPGVLTIQSDSDNSDNTEGVILKTGTTTTLDITPAVASIQSANTVVNTLYVTGALNGPVSINGGTITPSGPLSVGTGISAAGAVAGTSLSAGAGSISGGSLGVSGAISGASLSTTGGALVGGALTVNGPSTTSGLSNTGSLSSVGALTQTGTTSINTTGTAATSIGTAGGNTSIGSTASTNSVLGTTGINTTGAAVTSIGNALNTTNISSATNNLGVNAFATTNNIGSGTGVSTNVIGNGVAGTTVVASAGNSQSVLRTDLSRSTVTGGGSVLAGATQTTTAQSTLSNAGAAGFTVDANGRISQGVAGGTTAALTVTNGIGNVHGIVVTENQTTLSGGTQSTSLSLTNGGATFSSASTGGPVRVTGVADGTQDFDAVNYRQLRKVAGGVASVAAMANIPNVDSDKTFLVGVGLGSYQGANALAFGSTLRLGMNSVVRASVSTITGGNVKGTSYGVGAGFSW